jgi:hypothetical protein
MPKISRTLLAATLVAAAGVGTYKVGVAVLGSSDDDAASTKHLVNQVWIERMPRSERDMIGHLALVAHPRFKLGGAGRSSQWRHFVELFHWSLEGHRLGLYFPQEEVRGHVQVRTWSCEGEAPAPFELCLEISANDRKAVYYSKRDWVIDPHAAAGSLADLGERVPELAGMFDHVAPDGRPSVTAMEVTEVTADSHDALSDLSLLGQ